MFYIISTCFCVLTSGGLLGHAVGSVQGQDGVLGHGLFGRVIGFSGATAVPEQVEVSLPRCRAGSSPSRGRLCRSTDHIAGAHLKGGNRRPLLETGNDKGHRLKMLMMRLVNLPERNLRSSPSYHTDTRIRLLFANFDRLVFIFYSSRDG